MKSRRMGKVKLAAVLCTIAVHPEGTDSFGHLVSRCGARAEPHASASGWLGGARRSSCVVDSSNERRTWATRVRRWTAMASSAVAEGRPAAAGGAGEGSKAKGRAEGGANRTARRG
ncbi:unnamed protein product, partial [Ectocarpus sp. 4 AP-2014]